MAWLNIGIWSYCQGSEEKLTSLEGWQTYVEIGAQPRVWREWATELARIASAVRDGTAMSAAAAKEVWFCGAGSSSFIGEILSPYLNSYAGQAPQRCRFLSLPTTDFVAAPYLFLRRERPDLIVSFGRSGDSFESVASLRLLSEYFPATDLLNITCNPRSSLANPQGELAARTQVVCLPQGANDQGFAMTVSLTCMLLTALACFDVATPIGTCVQRIKSMALAAEAIQKSAFEFFDKLPTPSRCTFLGSGALTGAARESALKVLELSAGKIATQWDSCLGFRHGPKCFVEAGSLVFVYLSSDPYTRSYEVDLLIELRHLYPEALVVAVGANEPSTPPCLSLGGISWPDGDAAPGRDVWSVALYIQYAQIASLIWSHRMGINADNPFAGDNRLSRVVTDVTWHPYPGTRNIHSSHFTDTENSPRQI